MITLNVGIPAAGKSTQVSASTTILSRDTLGGSVKDLLPRLQAILATDPNADVVLDNTFGTVAERKPFIDVAQAAGAPIQCFWYATPLEEAQVNALNRMWDRYGSVFLDGDAIKKHAAANQDPNIFPAAAQFAYRKKFETPTVAEGFTTVKKIPFVRKPYSGQVKALILDYDGTLRQDAQELGFLYHYPTSPEQVKVLPGRKEVLEKYQAAGYLLLGASTQSGIAKGHLSDADAQACFDETNRQLGLSIDVSYCKHGSFPVACFCRKPQAGLGVAFIRKYGLNPKHCIMVGDLKTDETFAQRCGFQFEHADAFFSRSHNV